MNVIIFGNARSAIDNLIPRPFSTNKTIKLKFPKYEVTHEKRQLNINLIDIENLHIGFTIINIFGTYLYYDETYRSKHRLHQLPITFSHTPIRYIKSEPFDN